MLCFWVSRTIHKLNVNSKQKQTLPVCSKQNTILVLKYVAYTTQKIFKGIIFFTRDTNLRYPIKFHFL